MKRRLPARMPRRGPQTGSLARPASEVLDDRARTAGPEEAGDEAARVRLLTADGESATLAAWGRGRSTPSPCPVAGRGRLWPSPVRRPSQNLP